MFNRKTMLSAAIAAAMGGGSFSVSAALTSSATLDFTLGMAETVACTYGTTPPCAQQAYNLTDIVGSYFGVDTNNDASIDANEKIPIEAFDGIIIGAVQTATGSHDGAIDGSEVPGIDAPWTFLGATGMHKTTSPVTVLEDNGFTKTLDFSGWLWTWNGIDVPLVDLGTVITCDTISCSDGSNYTIDGAFHFSGAGFTSAPYALHLEGTVTSAVPVPAAAWLFGSGLLGLVGVARRRRCNKRVG